MQKTMLRTLLAAAVLTTSASALAHGDEDHGDPQPAAKKPAPAAPAPASATKAHAAGEDHDHPSPHGGQVVTVDKDVHAELVFSDGGVKVWFYDANMKPVAPPADGKLTLVVGKQTQKVTLANEAAPAPQDYVFAPVTLPKDGKVVAMVQGTVSGKPRTARVERAPAKASTAADPHAGHHMPAAKTN